MSLNETIINTALLGTATKELSLTDFPEELQGTFEELKEKTDDTEATFYQIVALDFAYFRAGTEPQERNEATEIIEATADEAAYFSRQAGDLLLSLVANRNRHLLLYAYRRALQCSKLIPPSYLQTLLTRAFERNNPTRKEEQLYLCQLTGNRGRWLLPLMGLPVWGTKNEIAWETASHGERKQLLLETRRENPDAGLALLQTELKNESAVHREDLIQCLREKLNKNDEAFLQGVTATDRSSNVKEAARQLLDSLPDSQQVQYYWELLKGKLRHHTLLGWTYETLEFTPEMKKWGLTEVSSVKNEKDDRFLLRQLAERVPLAFWCEFYDCEPEKAATKLAKNPPFQNLFELWKPIILFNDSLWAFNTLKEKKDESYLSSLLGLLTPAQREEISFPLRQKDTSIPSNWYCEDGEPWGIKFATYIFKCLLLRNYSIYKEEAEKVSVYFPAEMIPLIEKKIASVNDENSIAVHTCRLLLDYSKLKERIDTLIE